MYTNVAKNKRNSWLLIGVFIIIVALIGFVFSQALDNQAILYIAVALSLLYTWVSYYNSDKMILAVSRAREVKKRDAPELYRTVENLAITAGLPTPKVYVIEDSAPNAFATGRDPAHAVVAVTTGLLDKLDKPELEGVIAHELSHIGNYDGPARLAAEALAGAAEIGGFAGLLFEGLDLEFFAAAFALRQGGSTGEHAQGQTGQHEKRATGRNHHRKVPPTRVVLLTDVGHHLHRESA